MFFSDDEGKLSEGYKIFSERFGFCPREDIFVRVASENKIEKENGWLYHFVCFLFCRLSFAGICPDVFASFNRNAFPLRSEFTGLAYGICPTPGSW